MVTLRAFIAAATIVTALTLASRPAFAAIPDYKLGDTAQEDVITPVPLTVVNAAATEQLKRQQAQKVRFVIRHAPQISEDALAEFLGTIATVRSNYLATLTKALKGGTPDASDVGSPAFKKAAQLMVLKSPKNFPLGIFAPVWTSGESDEAIIQRMLDPLKAVMGRAVVATKTNIPGPGKGQVRLVKMKNLADSPTVEEGERGGVLVPGSEISGLYQARQFVITNFVESERNLGRFASSFVRTNASQDFALTALLRAKAIEGLAVNDKYEPAQIVVRKGQVIDQAALAALAALREKSLIGTLQNKLEQEQSVTGQISKQAKWLAGGLAFVCLAFVLVLWRVRSRPAVALLPVPANPALMSGTQPKALPGDAVWQERAITAEARADRAQEAIRTGVLHWMRERIVQGLFRQRAQLLSAQQKAEMEMRALEQRLEQLHAPLQERITTYEKRIAELEHDLAVKGEENRELIKAKITLARHQLNVERGRGGRFGTN
jgi:hypothetical protein